MARTLPFEVTGIVHASVESVWQVLGDFGTEHRWTRSLVHCSRDTEDVAVGTVRACQLPRPLMGRTFVRETLTEFEPGESLAYVLDGPAGPFASASSRWSTQAKHDATEVTITGTFQPKSRLVRLIVWPAARPMLRRFSKRVLRELDAFLISTPGITHR